MSNQPRETPLENWLNKVNNGGYHAHRQDWCPSLATFHQAIKDAIPKIVQLLKIKDYGRRPAGADAFKKLVEQRK